MLRMFNRRFPSLLLGILPAFAFLLVFQGEAKLAAQRSATNPQKSSLKIESRAWPEADQLFRSDPRWLGGDAAFSVDLGAGRVLWLFGDSFVARKAGDSRADSLFIRNSAAIQTGYDPAHATMKFYWRVEDGKPADFAAPEEKTWLWPAQGFRIGNRLLLFYSRMAVDTKKPSLGFAAIGWTAFLVDNPGQEPSAWTLRQINVPDGHGKIMMGTSVIQIADSVYVFGASEPEHDVYLLRWPAVAAANAQLSSPQWWCGPQGWLADISLRTPITHGISSEFSIQRDPRGTGFIEVNSQGFGSSEIVMRIAKILQGPWSAPQTLYRPPESDAPNPFVYAGKSHPELTGADLVVTYAANGPDQIVLQDLSLYFPRFVRVTLPPHQ
jgi:hypothetical protein